MPTKTKFTLTETTVLTLAATRRNGHILPLPEEADPTSPKVIKLLKSMLAAGLIEERRTTSAKSAWRNDPEGRHHLLRLTELGRTTAEQGAQPTMPAPSAIPEAVTIPEPDCPRPPGGKLGLVLSAVQSGRGASIGDLTALTGWQPHTVRASLTRLRQTGVSIQLTGDDGQKRYAATGIV